MIVKLHISNETTLQTYYKRMGQHVNMGTSMGGKVVTCKYNSTH
jgi:hypothetical protein